MFVPVCYAFLASLILWQNWGGGGVVRGGSEVRFRRVLRGFREGCARVPRGFRVCTGRFQGGFREGSARVLRMHRAVIEFRGFCKGERGAVGAMR